MVCDIKYMHFYFGICIHLLNIIEYFYASTTTCAYQVFHVHSSQTVKLVNIILKVRRGESSSQKNCKITVRWCVRVSVQPLLLI